MCAALTILGFKDKRLDETYEWMARSEIGKIERYYSAKSGPNFACGANGKKPCAWGCVKVMLALGTLPRSTWSQDIKSAVKAGADFLFSVDPLTAAYPTAFNTTPNRSWWQLGFPTFYCTDLLQLAEVLTLTGYGHDKRLRGVIDFIKSKQDSQGRWRLEHNYIGKTWGGFGKKGELNKWVTTRALKLFTLLDAD